MSTEKTSVYNVKLKKLPKSAMEISAVVPKEEFDATRGEAIKHLGREIELPGFRRGHIPEKILAAKLGEDTILEEMAKIAIGHAYPKILMDEKIDALGRPEVQIRKIAMGNPLEFVLVTSIFPVFALPDYKMLAARATSETKTDTLVSEDDLTKAIGEIMSMHRPADAKEGEEKKPELDDAFVKTLGDFAGVDEFKAKLRENLESEKQRAAKDKVRVAIIDAILAKTDIELPEIVVEQEVARMDAEFTEDVKRMGLTLDAYLGMMKKTKDEVLAEWRPTAEKRAKSQLVIGKIAETENIKPDEAALESEIAMLTTRYPNTPKERIRDFVHMLMTNDKVLAFLESQTH